VETGRLAVTVNGAGGAFKLLENVKVAVAVAAGVKVDTVPSYGEAGNRLVGAIVCEAVVIVPLVVA
jgi:hypothetical protein